MPPVASALSSVGRECRQERRLGENTPDLRVRRAERSVPTASYAGNAADGLPRLQRNIWSHTNSLEKVAKRVSLGETKRRLGKCEEDEPRS